jgi:hypothetical protein
MEHIRQNPWLGRCQKMLALSPSASQQAFISSVLSQIELMPLLRPTVPQVERLKAIEGHLERSQLADSWEAVLGPKV